MSAASRVVPTAASSSEDAAQFGAIERAVTRITGLSEARKPSGASKSLLHPLDRAAYSLLTRIGECHKVRLTELASTMGIDLSTASRQVRALEDRGLVERSGDPDDQRTRWLNLTDTGHHALEDARALRIEVLRRRLTAWNPLEVAELARLLEMFIASFDESSPADQQRGTDKNCDDAVQGTQSRIRRAAPTLSGVGGNLT